MIWTTNQLNAIWVKQSEKGLQKWHNFHFSLTHEYVKHYYYFVLCISFSEIKSWNFSFRSLENKSEAFLLVLCNTSFDFSISGNTKLATVSRPQWNLNWLYLWKQLEMLILLKINAMPSGEQILSSDEQVPKELNSMANGAICWIFIWNFIWNYSHKIRRYTGFDIRFDVIAFWW